MNKGVDERLVPNGEYVDALNVRLGSTEGTEIGAVENSKGNEELVSLEFKGAPLSSEAKCIGAFEDGGEETMYWFVHTMSDIIMAMKKNGIIVDYFKEYENDISANHKKNAAKNAKIPLSYILIGKKTEDK